jgi:hypothetical protein
MTSRPDDHRGLTRRDVIARAGATAVGATLLGGALAEGASAGASAVEPATVPLAFDAAIPGLTYLMVDATSFFPLVSANYRQVDDTVGTETNPPPSKNVAAPLNLTAGSVIRQINLTYHGTPTFKLMKRPVVGTVSTEVVSQPLASGGGVQTVSVAVDEPVDGTATYSLRFVMDATAESITAVSVGYLAAPSAYVPFTGPNPRALDTRAGPKYAPAVEHELDLAPFGAIGRAVVFNLTADQPSGIGYLSAYSADLPTWPGNSSLNYSTATPNIANGVITTLGAGGKIKLRAGEASTHVIVDVIGYLL